MITLLMNVAFLIMAIPFYVVWKLFRILFFPFFRKEEKEERVIEYWFI